MQSFSNWLGDESQEVIIYVDFDHTLVEVLSSFRGYDNYPKSWDQGKFTWEGRDYTAFVRPGARMFLKRLQSLATTLILTAGETEFQETAAEAARLAVPAIYGRDLYQEVPECKNGILIDNMDDNYHYTVEKLNVIGIKADRLIKVSTWHSNIRDDNGLLTILPKVQELLRKRN